MKLKVSKNELNIKILIESWFAPFSENDIEIFKVENSMLKNYLDTESIDNEKLLIAKNKIRKTDFGNILLIILTVIVLVTIFELIF